jgi:hypothetical protein
MVKILQCIRDKCAIRKGRKYSITISGKSATGGGFRNLMFPSQFTLSGGSFVFLDLGPFSLFLVFPLFWVLWFIF